MKIPSRILVLMLFLTLTVPAVSHAVQSPAETTVAATDDSDGTEQKTEKKKDKDSITISLRFFISLAIDVTMVLLIISLIYYPNYRKMDTIFTFIVFNIMIFLLTFVLNKVKMSMGAAFGLFAVFSMLRYRTEGIDMKDMTYLFIFIAVGLISGIQLDYPVLVIICGIVFVVALFLDSKFLLKRELTQYIEFEKIELVKPVLYDQLLEELKSRTGLKIHRIAIKKLDYLRDTASLQVYYYD
jgi:hypothetical protein